LPAGCCSPWVPRVSPDCGNCGTLPLKQLKTPPVAGEFMGRQLLLPRQMALELGGFDENFNACKPIALKLSLPIAWRQCELSISYIPRGPD